MRSKSTAHPPLTAGVSGPTPATETVTRYWERRRHIRVPVSGPARWQSGRRRGACLLLDISPGGAGLRLPTRRATQLGPTLDLEIELARGRVWSLPRGARVVRCVPAADGECIVGIEFPPDSWHN